MALHGQHTQGQNPYGNLLPPLGLPQQPDPAEMIRALMLRQQQMAMQSAQAIPTAIRQQSPFFQPPSPGAGLGPTPQPFQPFRGDADVSGRTDAAVGSPEYIDVFGNPPLPPGPDPFAPPIAGPQSQTQSPLAAAHFNQQTQDATGERSYQAFLDSPEGQLGQQDFANSRVGLLAQLDQGLRATELEGLQNENRRVSSVRLSPSQHRLNDENAMWDAIMARRQQQETQNAADYERAFGRPIFDKDLFTDPKDPAKGQLHERAGDFIAAMEKAGIPLPGAPDSEFEDQRARVASRGKKTFSPEELVKVQKKKDARQSELDLRRRRVDSNITSRQQGLPNLSRDEAARNQRIDLGTATFEDYLANAAGDPSTIEALLQTNPAYAALQSNVAQNQAAAGGGVPVPFAGVGPAPTDPKNNSLIAPAYAIVPESSHASLTSAIQGGDVDVVAFILNKHGVPEAMSSLIIAGMTGVEDATAADPTPTVVSRTRRSAARHPIAPQGFGGLGS